MASLIEIDPERRVERDVGLGFRQLVDIANRAMSTGQNDAYTATQAIHHVTTLLIDASQRSFATHEMRDSDDVVRVVLPIMDFPTHLRVVCRHVRQSGMERHPRVFMEVMRMLSSIADAGPSKSRLDALENETKLVMIDTRKMQSSEADIEEIVAEGESTLRHINAARITEPQVA